MVALERRSPVVLALLLVHWNAQAAAGGAGPSSIPVLDPWKELGIERGADPSEVRQAYLRKAREVHPDTSRGALPDGEAEERMLRPHPAQTTLSSSGI